MDEAGDENGVCESKGAPVRAAALHMALPARLCKENRCLVFRCRACESLENNQSNPGSRRSLSLFLSLSLSLELAPLRESSKRHARRVTVSRSCASCDSREIKREIRDCRGSFSRGGAFGPIAASSWVASEILIWLTHLRGMQYPPPPPPSLVASERPDH